MSNQYIHMLITELDGAIDQIRRTIYYANHVDAIPEIKRTLAHIDLELEGIKSKAKRLAEDELEEFTEE